MNKKKLNKFFLYFSASILTALTLSFIYVYFPKLPDSFDNNLRDYLFKLRGEIPNGNNVVIVDIDEKSLQQLGQWPWSRHKIASILEKLTQANAGIIGFDVVFAEHDKSSPHKVLKELNIKHDNPPNYDALFSKTISNTPTILGYQFELENKEHINSAVPNIPAIFIERNKPNDFNYLIKAHGTILNIPMIQNNAYSSGFFNNIPDDSGVIRSVPLIISYEDMIYPSLSLELLRVATQTQKVYINYNEQGVDSISLNGIDIPTDRYGRLLINFRGKERNFSYISAVDIFNDKFNPQEIEGKIVLIGASAAGILDLRAIPFESVFPGVEVHANAIDNIIEGDFIYKAPWVDGLNIIIIFVLSIMIVFLIMLTPIWANPIITLLFMSLSIYATYTFLFSNGIVINLFFQIVTIILASIVATLLDYFYEIKQEEAIKKKFASKVSKDVMDNLLKNLDDDTFQAMQKEVTVFFSDIRGFTQISESMDDAQSLIHYLNEYMEPMSNIITKYEGTIDKYIGDAIMAYWNAPADVQNHADKALQAALEQIKYLNILNASFKAQNKPFIDIGIGLNTGEAIVGEMGSIGRSDYTAIGDSINLGSRLESLCKYYNSKINISNFTKERLQEEYTFRFLDLVTVKGKSEPIEIWQVIQQEPANAQLQKELDAYHQAIDLYKNSQFEKALEHFIKLDSNKDKSNQNIYAIYIQRCQEYIKHPPENFNGVYTHTTKG